MLEQLCFRNVARRGESIHKSNFFHITVLKQTKFGSSINIPPDSILICAQIRNVVQTKWKALELLFWMLSPVQSKLALMLIFLQDMFIRIKIWAENNCTYFFLCPLLPSRSTSSISKSMTCVANCKFTYFHGLSVSLQLSPKFKKVILTGFLTKHLWLSLWFCSVKPTLKKVSKYENKFAKLQKKAAEFNFRNQLKQVKKKEFTMDEEGKDGEAKKPDWSKGKKEAEAEAE